MVANREKKDPEKRRKKSRTAIKVATHIFLFHSPQVFEQTHN
jgi:hypothetical protein